MPDKDGYPTDEEIEKIKKWDGIKNPAGLIDFLESIWWTPSWGFVKRNGRGHLFRKKCIKLEPHTGGWSGNETIINELERNWFWKIFWVQSHRGGHYYFEIPKDWNK